MRSKKKSKKKNEKRMIKCQEKKRKTIEPAKEQPILDLDAANCQYAMAQRFVKSIFTWKCLIPRNEYRDISEVILVKLSEELEYTPIGMEDRKSQQMQILADILACWISEILMQVSEKHKSRLEEECLKKRREIEEMIARKEFEDEDTDEEAGAAIEESSESEDDDDECQGQSNKVVQEEEPAEEEETAETIEFADANTQYDVADFGGIEEQVRIDASTDVIAPETTEKEVQTESDVQDVDTVTEVTVEDTAKNEMMKMAPSMSKVFESDLPFVNLAKILDALYSMIECCQSEMKHPDALDKRMHRAVYQTLANAIKCNDPKLLDNQRTRDVVDVVSGKLAKWMRKTLDDQQIKFLQQPTNPVESREIRDWSKWVADMADVADKWTGWINKVTTEARNIGCSGGMTRGDWQDWTKKFDTDALLWRRVYLEAQHQQHFNTMMLGDRGVQRTRPSANEVLVKNTNLETHD